MADDDTCGYTIIAPRHLLEEIIKRDDDDDKQRVPTTAAEARQRRLTNRRLEDFQWRQSDE